MKFVQNQIEDLCWQQKKLICGIDEAGRGCLAGPVVAAAVILPINTINPTLKDSKLLSPKKREQAYQWLIANAQCAFAIGSVESIAKNNILNSTKSAMRQAFLQLLAQLNLSQQMALDSVVIDAVKLALPGPCGRDGLINIYNPNNAENLSISVAAASIIAKVTRDNLLSRFEQILPVYGLGQHKGYGTSQHLAKILHFKSSLIHRQQFVATALKNLEQKNVQQKSF